MTQIEEAPARTRAQIGERTLRKDRWWQAPALAATLLSLWVAYATVRVFTGHWYFADGYNYLTPFYSPCVNGECVPGSSTLGTWIPAIPPIIPFAFVSLPFVLGFRLTCYYYRRTYYRAFWRSPGACAVREPHKKYSGETKFPLIMQNLHRYLFYMAIVISVLNTVDMVNAFWPNANPLPDHNAAHLTHGFGIGIGSLIILANVILLWAYTLSCHSCRHITGGRLKNFSKHPVRYWAWTKISWLNARHMQLAWTTLGTLMLTDLYIMLVAANAFPDLRIFN